MAHGGAGPPGAPRGGGDRIRPPAPPGTAPRPSPGNRIRHSPHTRNLVHSGGTPCGRNRRCGRPGMDCARAAKSIPSCRAAPRARRKAGPDRPGRPVSRRIMPHPHDARRGLVQNLAIRKANHVVSERSRLNDGADPPRSARPGPQMGARAPFRVVLKRSGGSPHMRGRLSPHIAAPARKRRRGMCERTATRRCGFSPRRPAPSPRTFLSWAGRRPRRRLRRPNASTPAPSPPVA